jgi:hypothetical protein
VREWVSGGGALLVIADHYPIGTAVENLAQRFAIEMSKGFTDDPINYERESGVVSQLVFTRAKGLIGKHPITQGKAAMQMNASTA